MLFFGKSHKGISRIDFDAECVKIVVFQLSSQIVFAQFFGALSVYLFSIKMGEDAVYPTLWFLSFLLIGIIDYFLFSSFKNVDQDDLEVVNRYKKYVMAINVLVGIFWGFSMFIFDGDAYLEILCVFVIVSTVILTGAVSLGVYPPLFYTLLIPTILFGAVWYYQVGLLVEYVCLLIVSLIIAYGLISNARASIYHSIKIREENKKLIAELEDKTREAEASDASKTRFLAAASHDLRQPMQAISFMVSALGNTQDKKAQFQIVSKLNGAIAELEGLFDALLDVSKLDSGVVKVNPQELTAKSLVDACAEKYSYSARSKGLALVAFADEELVLHTDPLLMNRILSNLVENAVRYTAAGSITLKALRDPDHPGTCLFSVADTGRGIAENMQEQIFDEFVQLDNPGRLRSHGLGLGLSIVRRLCKLLGAELRLTSQPDVGSEFQIRLACSEVPSQTGLQEEPQDPMLTYAGLKMLVLDNDQSVLDGLALLLQTYGCEVRLFSRTHDLLDSLSDQPAWSGLIADYRLDAEELGTDAVRQVRARLGENFPAIIMTGDISADRLHDLQASGIDYLHKPLKIEQLEAFLSLCALKRAPMKRLSGQATF